MSPEKTIIEYTIVANKATRVNNSRIVPAGYKLCKGCVRHLDEIAQLRRCCGSAWRVIIDEQADKEFTETITAPAVPQPSPTAPAALSDDDRAAAIADLSEIDGIGEKIAESFITHFNIDSRHALHAVLNQKASFIALANSDDLKASADDLAKWLKQLDAEAAAQTQIELFYFAEKHMEDGTVHAPAIYADAEGKECNDIEAAQAFTTTDDCTDFIAKKKLGKLFTPEGHEFFSPKDDDDADDDDAKDEGAE